MPPCTPNIILIQQPLSLGAKAQKAWSLCSDPRHREAPVSAAIPGTEEALGLRVPSAGGLARCGGAPKEAPQGQRQERDCLEGPVLQCQAEELKPYSEGPGGWASRKRWDGVLCVQGRQLESGGKEAGPEAGRVGGPEAAFTDPKLKEGTGLAWRG